MALFLNRCNSWWHIDIIRLCAGIAGSVWKTAFSFEAVIFRDLSWNHKDESACRLVFNSAAMHCSGDMVISVSADTFNSSKKFIFNLPLSNNEVGSTGGKSGCSDFGKYEDE